jgi:hypothetical protein
MARMGAAPGGKDEPPGLATRKPVRAPMASGCGVGEVRMKP